MGALQGRDIGTEAGRGLVKHRTNAAGELTGGKGFFNEVQINTFTTMMGKDISRVARHEQYLDVGSAFNDPLGQSSAIHLWHDDICNQQINGLWVLIDVLQRLDWTQSP